jgi:hypothetical protein
MAGESIAASKSIDKSIGSAGVRMVKSVSILDTSEKQYVNFSTDLSMIYVIHINMK